MYLDPTKISRVTSIGAGPIGGGWSAHFLARGYEVTSYLHSEDEVDSFMGYINTAWKSLKQLGLEKGASLDNLRITFDLKNAVQNAQFMYHFFECLQKHRKAMRLLVY